MTSNDTSSSSPKTSSPEPMTSDRLLSEPQKLREIVWLLGSQGWEAMELWLQTELQALLERLLYEEDPQKREGYRAVAKWLKYFMTEAKDRLTDLDHSNRNPEPPVETEYMEFDSEGKSSPRETLDKPVPPGQS